MSWDLLVVTHDRASPDAISDLLAAGEKYVAQGSLEPPSANVLVSRSRKDGAQAAFTIDGPHVIEIDDLPEALAAAVLAPRFLREVSVPAAATAGDRSVALGVAKQLAKRLHGAVHDPQADEVV